MSNYDKIYRVDRKPEKIPSGCVAAWQWNTSPPKIWYEDSSTNIVELPIGGSGGLTNPLTTDLDAGSNKITDLATGTNSNDAVNKAQMDAAISAAIPSGSGITQGSWSSISAAAGFTNNTVKTALQSTGRVMMSGRIGFAASWGAGSSCGKLILSHRPTSDFRIFQVTYVNTAFTDSYTVTVRIGTNGDIINQSGTAISSAGWIYFDGVSFQRDEP